MATTRKVKWETHHYEFNDEMNGLEQSEDEDIGSFEDGEVHLDPTQAQIMSMFEPDPPKALMNTPVGVYEIDNSMNPYRHYKFYICHTNFTIDEETRQTIKNFDGIEILKIISRYRFLIGIGQLFDSVQVRFDLGNVLCNPDTNNDSSNSNNSENSSDNIQDVINKVILSDGTRLNELIENLKKYKRFAIYVFPNGKYDFVCYDDASTDEVKTGSEEKITLMLKALQESNGLFIDDKTKY